MKAYRGIGVIIGTITCLAAPCAFGNTLRVTNDGTDSASCGATTTPCRSISQAIENAYAGDVIEVGAGRYGNISGDGTFSHPGDEHPQPPMRIENDSDAGESPGCMICIFKAVSIYSLHGASVTIIEGPAASANYAATVLIASYNVRFGAAGRGFTITGGNTYGVRFDQNLFGSEYHPPGVSVTIAGNSDVGDGTAFSFEGMHFWDNLCRYSDVAPYPCSPAAVSFVGNTATNNPGAAFDVELNSQIFIGGGRILLQGNIANGGGTGFAVHPGHQDDIGQAYSASNVSVLGNVAAHYGLGFDLDLAGDIERNTAAGNARAGFSVVPDDTHFTGNSTLGNRGPGLIVNFSADWFDGGTDPSRHFASIAGNNFYGNDRDRPTLGIGSGGVLLDTGTTAHCGILNVGAVATIFGPAETSPPPKEPLSAAKEFWGVAKGASATGPGDAVGGACDKNGGTTSAPTPAPLAFAITALP
jgi:hypothetical protein